MLSFPARSAAPRVKRWSIEEGDGFGGGLEEAAGFGLEGEEDVAAVALAIPAQWATESVR
jgi:hypothetical protein